MAGRSAHVRRVSTANETRTVGRRRSSSQGDNTPRMPVPAGGLLATSSHSAAHPTSHSTHLAAAAHSVLAATSLLAAAAPHHRSVTSPIPPSLLPTRTHSRGEAAVPLDRAHSPAPPSGPSMATSPPPQNKGLTSPSKPSSTRTYDSKLVSREMHRLGNLTHLPSLQLPPPSLSLSATPSSLSLNMAPTSAPSISASLSGENPWASLHVFILPLFNREQLRVQLEDLNQLVKRHISTVVSVAPGKAVAALEHDTCELIAAGMVTLNAELSGVEEEKVVPRVVETWSFFWSRVLPYLEGALLPLQTDPILSSLYRIPKSHRPSSPTSAQNGKSSTSNLLSSPSQIDVRALALVSFRDRIILPLFPKLYARLSMSKDENSFGPESQQARLQQMLLVLVSQRSQRLVSLSLTAPPPQPTAGEAAVARLLRALHAPLASLAPRHNRTAGGLGAPSFLSAGLPRDRRGRIAQKDIVGSPRLQAYGGRRDRWRWGADVDDGYGAGAGAGGDAFGPYDGESSFWDDGEADTPRVGVSFADPVRERDKELLESLRSPDADSSARMNMAGWGGVANANSVPQAGIPPRGPDPEDEDDADLEDEEDLDWDQAQAMVEHMVGIGAKHDGGPVQQSQQQGVGQDTRRGRVEGYKV
ncbi:HbrB-domain-containing protein [Ganoderma leucocontextum]|nr:HbrB-domain-containing protein [Ganoderma leucocontextum]